MADLIDKARVIALVKEHLADARRTYKGFGQAQEALTFVESLLVPAIAALPPVTVGVLDRAAGQDKHAGWTLPIELLCAIKDEIRPSGYGGAVCLEEVEMIALAVERRILAALAPAEAGGVRDNRAALLNRFLDDWEDQLDAEMVAELHSIVAGIDHQTGTDLAALAPAEAGGVDGNDALFDAVQSAMQTALALPETTQGKRAILAAIAKVRLMVRPAEAGGVELETCGKCMGSGYGGHPDSGAVCYVCGGSGGVTLAPVDALVKAADRIANWTIGGLVADHPENREKYPLLTQAILELRAALAALRGDAK